MRAQLCPSLFTRNNDSNARSNATDAGAIQARIPSSSTRLARCKCGCTIPRRRRCWEEIILLFRQRTPITLSAITSRLFWCFPCRSHLRTPIVADGTDASVILKGSSSYADTLVCLRPANEVTVTFGPLSSLSTIELGANLDPKKKKRSKSLTFEIDDPEQHTLKRQRAFENVRDAAVEGFLMSPDRDESGEMELFELKEMMKPVVWKD